MNGYMKRCWESVDQAVKTAKAISFDGCHKIYVLMDDDQVAQSREWGYGEGNSELIEITDPQEAFDQVREWYEDSCLLRFVESVRSVTGDPNLGYHDLIPQGADDEGWDL